MSKQGKYYPTHFIDDQQRHSYEKQLIQLHWTSKVSDWEAQLGNWFRENNQEFGSGHIRL